MRTTTEIIKGLRRRMSQSEIARRTNMPQPRLSRWESGDVPAGADDALKLFDLARTEGLLPDELPAVAAKAEA